MRFLSIPLVAIVLVAGLWVTGGLITNDFTVAMWLSAAWMALAGVACLAIAARSRSLRWAVLGSYVVTAAVVGAYLSMSIFLQDEVNERVAVAAPPTDAGRTTSRGSAGAGGGEASRNVRLRAGSFAAVAHQVRGEATFIELAEGGRVLTLTDFEVDNGPDLRVYLVAGGARNEGEVEDFVDLGALKGNKGNQQYSIPKRADIERHSTVVIWCRAFSVLFARAPTRA